MYCMNIFCTSTCLCFPWYPYILFLMIFLQYFLVGAIPWRFRGVTKPRPGGLCQWGATLPASSTSSTDCAAIQARNLLCLTGEYFMRFLACFSNMQNNMLNLTQHERGTNSVETSSFHEAIVSHLNPPGSEKFPCGDSKDLKVSTRSKWASGESVGNAVYKDRKCGRKHGQHNLLYTSYIILGPLPGSTPGRYPAHLTRSRMKETLLFGTVLGCFWS